MLEITIPAREMYDEANREFISIEEQTLELEHSLVALSKWESKYHKPFISKEDKTLNETLDYIKYMTITKNVNPDTYNYLTQNNINQINEYIGNSMTATTFSDTKRSIGSRRVITSELIYCWMITLNIPVEFENWHLNRLLTLIRVCEIENTPPKKQSKRDILSRNAALNAKRRQQINSKG